MNLSVLEDVEVLILAGGKGTRLQSVVSDVPKPLAPIRGRPFLEYLISYVSQFGPKNFRLLTVYKGQKIVEHFGDGTRLGVRVNYSHEETPLLTGGALRQAIGQSHFKKFLALNGDTFFKIDFARFIQNAQELGPGPVIALREIINADRYGSVSLDSSSHITGFANSAVHGRALINAGIYYFTHELLSDLPEGPVSLENEVFPKLINSKKLWGVPFEGFFIDIGVPQDYQKACDLLDSRMEGKI